MWRNQDLLKCCLDVDIPGAGTPGSDACLTAGTVGSAEAVLLAVGRVDGGKATAAQHRIFLHQIKQQEPK
jgi:hypothetical protein